MNFVHKPRTIDARKCRSSLKPNKFKQTGLLANENLTATVATNTSHCIISETSYNNIFLSVLPNSIKTLETLKIVSENPHPNNVFQCVSESLRTHAHSQSVVPN